MTWILDLATGLAEHVVPFILSLGGLAVPGLGVAGMVGGALTPRVFRTAKWFLILAGLAAVAIYILVIKLDAARKDTEIARQQKIVAERERDIETCKTSLNQANTNTRLANAATDEAKAAAERNFQMIAKLRADHEAAIDELAKQHHAELKRRATIAATKEKIDAAAKLCPGVPPAVREFLDGMRHVTEGDEAEPAAGGAAPPGRATGRAGPAQNP